MPLLPVLTTENAVSEAEWHSYIERVYHQRIRAGDVVDLNQFSFFYSDHPAVAVTLLGGTIPCLEVCPMEVNQVAYEGTLWNGLRGPEHLDFGFFVARPFLLTTALPSCDHLEVTHVFTEWAGLEVGVSWFFHTVGSGVFLDCHSLPTEGRIEAYTSRADFMAQHDGYWMGDGAPGISSWMEEHGVKMLVITQADYSNQMGFAPGTTNPRTEIIVRQAQSAADGQQWWGGTSEKDLPHKSCLTDDSMGFTFWTGIEATEPCRCLVSERVNCDGGER